MPTGKCTFQVWSRKTSCMLKFCFWVFFGHLGNSLVHHKDLLGVVAKKEIRQGSPLVIKVTLCALNDF